MLMIVMLSVALEDMLKAPRRKTTRASMLESTYAGVLLKVMVNPTLMLLAQTQFFLVYPLTQVSQ